MKLVKDVIFTEREVESAKIELALKSDFNITDAFNQIDLSRSGTIAQSDLREGLMQNLAFIYFTTDDIRMLVTSRHECHKKAPCICAIWVL